MNDPIDDQMFDTYRDAFGRADTPEWADGREEWERGRDARRAVYDKGYADGQAAEVARIRGIITNVLVNPDIEGMVAMMKRSKERAQATGAVES